MLKETVTQQEAIDFLNELLKIDRETVQKLIKNRIICNKDLAYHSTVQVQRNGNNYVVGLLGILNGLFGTDDAGYGAIASLENSDGTILRFEKYKKIE